MASSEEDEEVSLNINCCNICFENEITENCTVCVNGTCEKCFKLLEKCPFCNSEDFGSYVKPPSNDLAESINIRRRHLKCISTGLVVCIFLQAITTIVVYYVK